MNLSTLLSELAAWTSCSLPLRSCRQLRGLVVHAWSASVLAVWPEAKRCPRRSYSEKAGLRKYGFLCGEAGGWGLRPFPLLLCLWGPVRPRYFPSLIDSRDGPLAGGGTVSGVEVWESAWEIYDETDTAD